MPESFQVACSGESLEEFKQMYQQARKGGFSREFLAASRAITDRLQSEPTSLGEPLYNLAQLKLVMWIGIIAPLVVHFAVHLERPMVIIRKFSLLPSHDDDSD